jgi:hypothetical protein
MAMGEQHFFQPLKPQTASQDLLLGAFTAIDEETVMTV